MAEIASTPSSISSPLRAVPAVPTEATSEPVEDRIEHLAQEVMRLRGVLRRVVEAEPSLVELRKVQAMAREALRR